MGGFFLDNVCVLVGTIVLSLAGVRSYTAEELPKKTREGLLDFSNWLEAITGLTVLLTIWGTIAAVYLLF